jgi:hypothetical protein
LSVSDSYALLPPSVCPSLPLTTSLPSACLSLPLSLPVSLSLPS